MNADAHSLSGLKGQYVGPQIDGEKTRARSGGTDVCDGDREYGHCAQCTPMPVQARETRMMESGDSE